jgi:dihydropteroate synthase
MAQRAKATPAPSGQSEAEIASQKTDMALLMGVLNVTPDSFSDGGQFKDVRAVLRAATKMLKQGADILDIGGESTRPGSSPVSEKEELERVIPVIHAIHDKHLDAILSIDTYKAEVAAQALEAGATIVNDVWGLSKDPGMIDVVADYQAPVVINHWESKTYDGKNVMRGMKLFFEKTVNKAVQAGVREDNIILDPGIGFGKTAEANLVILQDLKKLKSFGLKILVGASRKSFLGRITGEENPQKRLTATLAAHQMAVLHGADILRVHDVEEHVQMLKVLAAISRKSL